MESFLVLIIELEGRADKQKHGPASNFLGDFPSSHPSRFLSPSSPVFLSPPFLVFWEAKEKDVNLISMGNILMEESPINTISEKNTCSTFKMLLFSSHSVFSFPYLLASNFMKHLCSHPFLL